MNARRGLLLVALLQAAAAAAASVAGDADRGEAIYGRCQACHALAYDRTGPRHCGLFGRRAGSLPGFAFSPALRASAIVWDEASLDLFLASPTTVLPGTTMGYSGIADSGERADLIAWLRRATAPGAGCGG